MEMKPKYSPKNQRKKAVYTEEKIAWMNEHINDDCTLEELSRQFSEKFNHHVSRMAFNKALTLYCGHKPRVCKWKPESKNAIGTVIANKDGKKCRVKTEHGYVPADTYFKKLYGLPERSRIVHLNGNYADFSRENIVPVSHGIHTAMAFRHWFFSDPERTKAAILCAELLILLGSSKNENQFLKITKR